MAGAVRACGLVSLAWPDRRPRGGPDRGAGARAWRGGAAIAGRRAVHHAAAAISRDQPAAVSPGDRVAGLYLCGLASRGLAGARRADPGTDLGRYRQAALCDHRLRGVPSDDPARGHLQQPVGAQARAVMAAAAPADLCGRRAGGGAFHLAVEGLPD